MAVMPREEKPLLTLVEVGVDMILPQWLWYDLCSTLRCALYVVILLPRGWGSHV